MAKNKLKKLKKDLDSICREIILIRDKNCCQKTGKPVSGSNAHRHHIIPVSRGNALRWCIDNQILFSFHSHINWWHKNILEAQNWFANGYPVRESYLWQHRNDIVKFSLGDLEQLLIELRQKHLELINAEKMHS